MKRRVKWIVTGAVVGVLLLPWLVAPAATGRAIKDAYHGLPGGLTDAVPDDVEQNLGRSVDAVARFFTFGSAERTADLDLRLTYASVAPGTWGPGPDLRLEWDPLGNGVEYDIRLAGPAPTWSAADPVGRTAESGVNVTLPGDGQWHVLVRPHAGSYAGRVTSFGPFRIDPTPPPAPVLGPIPEPPGYSFTFQWAPSTDVSGIAYYVVERMDPGAGFQEVARQPEPVLTEDQLGNGKYAYRIRAVNGAGLVSAPSQVQEVVVRAPMQNPGPGQFRYGIHANYTSFIKLWDLTTPAAYATIDEVPAEIATAYLGAGYGFEIENQTLRQVVAQIVGAETNTLRISEAIFRWLYDYADYDQQKLNESLAGQADGLQRAGLTYDRKKGICGDLATLYITLLRIAGVPARAVHGYLDNPSAGIGDFHVWVEVWVGASLRSGNPDNTRDDWMTVDVSGITGPFHPGRFLLYFGIFNPDYLALGLKANYASASWNAWAQFGWSNPPNRQDPRFLASGRPVLVDEETRDLLFNPDTKQRELVTDGRKAARPGMNQWFSDVTVVSKKRIDYGVDMSGPAPTNATIRLRFPDTDAYAAVLPWQSVIYTPYTKSTTVTPQGGRSYAIEPLGFVVWQDRF